MPYSVIPTQESAQNNEPKGKGVNIFVQHREAKEGRRRPGTGADGQRYSGCAQGGCNKLQNISEQRKHYLGFNKSMSQFEPEYKKKKGIFRVCFKILKNKFLDISKYSLKNAPPHSPIHHILCRLNARHHLGDTRFLGTPWNR